MAQYDTADRRATDLSGRISYLTTMAGDADALAHAFEKFAKRTIADPTAHAFLARIATCCRDFAGHLSHIFATMPESLRDAIKQSK
jgi:hypothetical protein